MKRIINFGIEEVYDISTGKQKYDTLLIGRGQGRGVLESGQAPSFEEKMQQFDALMESGVKLPLGGIDKKGQPAWEAMSERDLKCRYNKFRPDHKIGRASCRERV